MHSRLISCVGSIIAIIFASIGLGLYVGVYEKGLTKNNKMIETECLVLNTNIKDSLCDCNCYYDKTLKTDVCDTCDCYDGYVFLSHVLNGTNYTKNVEVYDNEDSRSELKIKLLENYKNGTNIRCIYLSDNPGDIIIDYNNTKLYFRISITMFIIMGCGLICVLFSILKLTCKCCSRLNCDCDCEIPILPTLHIPNRYRTEQPSMTEPLNHNIVEQRIEPEINEINKDPLYLREMYNDNN